MHEAEPGGNEETFGPLLGPLTVGTAHSQEGRQCVRPVICRRLELVLWTRGAFLADYQDAATRVRLPSDQKQRFRHRADRGVSDPAINSALPRSPS